MDEVSDIAAALFFADEPRQIADLLTASATVKADDRKLDHFLTQIVAPLRRQGQKLLVFTEYRATQDYPATALEKRYPAKQSCSKSTAV